MSSKTITITGAEGALGRYAKLYFEHKAKFSVVQANRSSFADRTALAGRLHADIVLHLAGINRGSDSEVGEGNPGIARELVAALEQTDATPHLIYASSVHENGDSVYGRSKREAGDILEDWATRSGAKFTRLLLPHLYSELVRPDYNSAIATFCDRVANGGRAEIIIDAEIYPLHAFDVCSVIEDIIADVGVSPNPLGSPTRMSEILSEIGGFHEFYIARNIVPDLRDPERLRLFNTYRAHLYPATFPIVPVLHTDDRGNLFEAVREANGGQTFVSTTRPGITRGNHFHFHKVERFCVLRGSANISLRNMATGQRMEFDVSGDRPCFIDMPTLWTHNITNVGREELLTLFWTHEIFDPNASDTYPATV